MSTWKNADRVTEAEAAPMYQYKEALGALVWHMRTLEDLRLRVLLRHETLRTQCVRVVVTQTQEHVRQLQAAMRPMSDFYHHMGGFVMLDCAAFEASGGADLMAQAKHALVFAHERLRKWYLLEGRPTDVVHTVEADWYTRFTEHMEKSYWEGYIDSYAGLMGGGGGGEAAGVGAAGR